MDTSQSSQIILNDIPVLIQRKKNIKRLSIKIDAYKGVVLNAPFYIPESIILPFLESAKPWINKHYQPIVHAYAQGENHLFLGTYYPLNLIQNESKAHVVIDNHQMNIYSHTLASDIIQNLLQDFYKRQAQALLPERLKLCMTRTPWVMKTPTLKLRFMRSRYGSCSSIGNISLNIHLIKARTALIDYVIFHELCHIKEHNHGPKFYALMQQVLPNWPELKLELKQLKF